MNITLIPSVVGETGADQNQFLTSYLVNDTLAIDAGGLGFYREPQRQAAIKHVLITHTHIDHIASLAIFVDNAYEAKPECVTIHGSTAVLDSLQRDLFNDRVWPDFIALSVGRPPFLKLSPLYPGQPLDLEGLRITPVSVNHVVPTTGFIIEEQASAVVIVSDTGPTDEIWRRANATPNLKAVFLEVTFPNAMAHLADVSKHLTPALFGLEVGKLHAPATPIAVHIKARFRAQVVNELQAMGLPNLEIGQFGKVYSF